MIFSGDMVFPSSYESDQLGDLGSQDFLSQPKIVNLESAIELCGYKKLTKGIGILSNTDIVEFLRELNVRCVTLANNHIFDFDIDIVEQKKFLNEHNIQAIGAGTNIKDASKPYVDHELKMVVLTFGWNVIRCKYALNNQAGVNPYEYSWVLEQVKSARLMWKDYQLIVTIHCNYEFEMYPQPADREFAHKLIESGCNMVLGHHPHIIQGFECYEGKSIFYGLGNFYFPNCNYSGFEISFPDVAKRGLSVQVVENKIKVYVTELKENRKINVVESGVPEDISVLNELSDFSGLSNKEYIKYFRANRKKSKALPIYKSYTNEMMNDAKDLFVRLRQIPVDAIGRYKGR